MAEVDQRLVAGLSHCGLTVSDMEQSLAFYRDGLGLEITIDRVADHDYLREVTAVPSREVRIVYLQIPNSKDALELLEHRGIERLPVRSRPCDPGNTHVCFYVNDVEHVHDRMQSLGYTSRSGHTVLLTAGPFKGARTCFLTDPDGFLVELFQPPEAAGES